MLSDAQQQLQRASLIAFYRATGGDLWARRDNWEDETQPISSFYGVTVDATSRAVIKIDLHNNGLSGATDLTHFSCVSKTKLHI